MKIKILLSCFFFAVLLKPFTGKTQVNTQDSLALVDLYNSTNGSGWIDNTNWLTTAPVSTWFGIKIFNQRVSSIQLINNKLVGNIPPSLGNITDLATLFLGTNQLSGSIPLSLANLIKLHQFDLQSNQLSGTIPVSFAVFSTYANFSSNNFTFSDLENVPLAYNYPQADIPLIINGNIISVAAGGGLSNTTYKWYKDDSLVSTKIGDSTFLITSPGNYSAEVTNSILPSLTLYSVSTPNQQDSLALVDLYLSTNGSGWINHLNWLTSAPVSTWYGVTLRRGRVRSLYLYANKLTGILPASIGNFTLLTGLTLTTNQLSGNIPSSLGNLYSLTGLGLGQNNLSGEIPASLGNLSGLTGLSLDQNQLTGVIPVSFGNLSQLTSLYLKYNKLSGTIPNSLTKLSKLGWLYLDNNLLTGTIPDSLGYLPLNTLSLNDNQLTGAVPFSLNKLKSLVILSLENNSFTFSGMESLPNIPILSYAPQSKISLNKNSNLVSVYAGGSLINNTFRIYKDSVLVKTQTGDSSFAITTAGKYYVTVTNSIATQLTLTSTIDTIIGLVIADTTVSVTQNIAGTTPVLAEDSVLHKLIATLTPTAGVNALSGSVTSTVFIDKTISVFNNQPYVQRHYDITPATNAANAQATVTLYFTQQEFDNFNAYPGHGLSLPTGPSDAAGKANLRVYQFHGFSATSLPGTYSGNAVEINPADGNIVWNAAAQYWEVSFAVNGFSGFFISSLNGAILPIKLLSFSGTVLDKKATLKWITTVEINASYYELQRSSTGNNFNAITKIAASGSSSANLNYQYTDMLGSDPVYFYRLKMADKDGGFTLSNVVKLSSANNAMFTIFPNPAKAFVFVNLPVATTDSKIKISDMAGRILRTIDVKKSTSQLKLNTGNLPAGNYKIIYTDGEKEVSKMMVIE